MGEHRAWLPRGGRRNAGRGIREGRASEGGGPSCNRVADRTRRARCGFGRGANPAGCGCRSVRTGRLPGLFARQRGDYGRAGNWTGAAAGDIILSILRGDSSVGRAPHSNEGVNETSSVNPTKQAFSAHLRPLAAPPFTSLRRSSRRQVGSRCASLLAVIRSR